MTPRFPAVIMFLSRIVRGSAFAESVMAREAEAAVRISARTGLPACRFRFFQRGRTEGRTAPRRIGGQSRRRSVVVDATRSIGVALLATRTRRAVPAIRSAFVRGSAPTAAAEVMSFSFVEGRTAGSARFVALERERAAVAVGAAGLPAEGFCVGLGCAAEFIGMGERQQQQQQEEEGCCCQFCHGLLFFCEMVDGSIVRLICN